MWLLFHHSKGTKRVADGRVLTEHCPTCNQVTRLDEVETTEQVGVWFVDVAGDTERGFRCRVCGDVFSLRTDAEPTKSAPKQLDTAKRDVERRSDAVANKLGAAERERARIEAMAAEQRRRDAERAAKATRIDDELAELKKRMGR